MELPPYFPININILDLWLCDSFIGRNTVNCINQSVKPRLPKLWSPPPHRLPPPDQSTLTSGGPQRPPLLCRHTADSVRREPERLLNGWGWGGEQSFQNVLSFLCRKQWQIHKWQRSDPLNVNKSPLEGLKAHPLHSCWGVGCVLGLPRYLPANTGDSKRFGFHPLVGRFL